MALKFLLLMLSGFWLVSALLMLFVLVRHGQQLAPLASTQLHSLLQVAVVFTNNTVCPSWLFCVGRF